MKKRFHKVIGILMTVLLTATMIPILPVAAASHESIRNSVMDVLYGGKSGGSLLCDYHGSGYNGIHEGVDYQLKEGTPIYSIADGTVTRVTNSTSDYVLSTLAIYNSDVNITVVYLHSNAITVKVGDHIKRGDRIAEEGKHGNKIKITPHTHIELRYGKQTSATKSLGDNTASNPDPYPLYEKLGYPLKNKEEPWIKLNSNSITIQPSEKKSINFTFGGDGIDSINFNCSSQSCSIDNKINWNNGTGSVIVSDANIKYGNKFKVFISLLNNGKVLKKVECTVNVEMKLNTSTSVKDWRCWDYLYGGDFYAGIRKYNNENAYFTINTNGNVQLGDKSYSSEKLWHFQRQSDSTYKITNVKTGKLLTVEGGAATKGTNVSVYDSNGGYNQKWFLMPWSTNNADDGIFYIRCSYCDKFLDVYDNGTSPGTNIHIWDGNRTDAQRLAIVRVFVTITYNDNGGSGGPGSQKFYYGDKVTLSGTAPKRSGYTFKGWSTSSSTMTPSYYSGKSYDLSSGGINKISLYAVWEANTRCTISYNANGGTGAPSSQSGLAGDSCSLSSQTPTRTGYTFKGWSARSDATIASFQPGAKLTYSSSLTLYAVWEASQYTVTYNANGGSDAPSKQVGKYGETIKISSLRPSRSGYKFKGWAILPDSTVIRFYPGDSYSVITNQTLYAVWEAEGYTVNYDANGGSGAPSAQTKAYGQTLTLSSTKPTRAGYVFKGWSISANSTTVSYNAGGSYTNNGSITLYAVWEAEGYTVKYDANGGSGAPSAQMKAYGKTLTLSSTKPTRTGYVFKGWSTSTSSTTISYNAGGSYTNNSSITLYAVWEAEGYIVKYDANGGSGAPSAQTKRYGETLTLSSSKPIREGYSFRGWSITDNSITVDYVAGSYYVNNKGVTLYAVWEQNPTHKHQYEEPTWEWNRNQLASATFRCTSGDDIIKLDANVTSQTTVNATHMSSGIVTYTASVIFDGQTYTNDKTEQVPKLAEHTYGEPRWQWNGVESVTATFECVAGDDTRVLEASIRYDDLKKATEKEEGQRKYIATISFNGSDYSNERLATIPKQSYDNPQPLDPVIEPVVDNPFEDVSENSYYYNAVLWAFYSTPQVTNGMDATHFGPQMTVTRAQAVTFLWRSMGCPEPSNTSNPFMDVPFGEWFYKPVLWAVENGITKGVDVSHFNPMDTLSTQHMITFMYRTKNPGQDGWSGDAAAWAADENGRPFGVATAVNNTTPCPRSAVVQFLYELSK